MGGWRQGLAPSAFDNMRSWTGKDTVIFLQHNDLNAAAKAFRDNDVSSADLVDMTLERLESELRFTRFGARKVLTVREEFLTEA